MIWPPSSEISADSVASFRASPALSLTVLMLTVSSSIFAAIEAAAELWLAELVATSFEAIERAETAPFDFTHTVLNAVHRALHLFQHPVERADHAADFVAGVVGDTFGQVVGCCDVDYGIAGNVNRSHDGAQNG